MATPQDAQKIGSRIKLEMWDHDPDATTATVCTGGGYVALRDFTKFAVAAMSSALTGNGITLLEIVAAEDSSGSNATQIKTSGTIAADAVGDWAFLEVQSEQIRQEGVDNSYDFTHVAARITVANAADEAVVVYIRSADGGRFQYEDLTPDTTIA